MRSRVGGAPEGGNADLLDRSAPAPPRRKRQLQTSMERSLPTYQLLVMFSWFTISASLLGSACTQGCNPIST